MKSFSYIFFLAIILFFTENTLAQNIQINDTYTAQQLVENVLVNSPCATVSNFSVSGGNFSDGTNSYAYFTNTSPAFPFSDGIVLSTGKAILTEGPSSNLSDNGNNMGWSGDADLEQALGVNNTINRTILEFDFTPQTNKISFDYIFASEEYHGSAQCRYSDGFAFLLKKANTTDTYQNLALIPGTTIPVKVTSVHPDVPGGCSAQNEAYFGSYNGSNHPTTFDGQTVIMKAQSDVEVGQLYHIKLVIADEGNYRYDSAIFLRGGSFQSETDLGVDRLISTNNAYCSGANVTLNAAQPGINTYKWFKNGIEDTTVTTPTYTIIENTNTNVVNYAVEVTINSSCISTGDVNIQFDALPVLSNQTLVQCDNNNDGIATFILTTLDNLIKNNDSTLGNVTYFETIGGTAIANPSSYNSIPKTIYAEVANASGCKSVATITLQIANNTINSPIIYKKCDEDGTVDGKTNFDLNTEVTPLVLTGLPSGLVVEYYATSNNAASQSNPLLNIFAKSYPEEESIFARVVNGPDCYGIIEVKLTINVLRPPNFEEIVVGLCNGSSVDLSVASGFNSYSWSNGDADFETEVTTAGNYTVTVTDGNGCKATKNFIVQVSAPATNIDATIDEYQGNSNSILITYTDNGGNYWFSIDGINYQENPYFTNVVAGEYTISVKDMNGCLPTPTKVIYVLDYPKFFTPNGDGIHDTWVIKNIKTKPLTTINVFDRFGKLLKQFNSNSNGWNGEYNGKSLPAGDYWFTLTLFNGKTVKSHFTLKR